MNGNRRASDKRYRVDRELGRPRIVPAAAVVAHVESLRRRGWSKAAIAEAAGIEKTTLGQILHRRAGLHRDTACRLLSVTEECMLEAGGSYVPALGTRRRIQALMAIGWSHRAMSAASGISRTEVIISRPGPWVTRATAEAIADMYERLCMTPGPSTRSRTRAQRAGYAPPLAWDDIDDPDEEPQGAPNSSHHLDLDEFVHLVRFGEFPTRAAHRLGVKLDSIYMAATRHHRADILTLLRRINAA